MLESLGDGFYAGGEEVRFDNCYHLHSLGSGFHANDVSFKNTCDTLQSLPPDIRIDGRIYDIPLLSYH